MFIVTVSLCFTALTCKNILYHPVKNYSKTKFYSKLLTILLPVFYYKIYRGFLTL